MFFKAWSKQIFPDVKDDHQYHSCIASIYVYLGSVMAQKNVLKLFSSKGVRINTMLHVTFILSFNDEPDSHHQSFGLDIYILLIEGFICICFFFIE